MLRVQGVSDEDAPIWEVWPDLCEGNEGAVVRYGVRPPHRQVGRCRFNTEGAWIGEKTPIIVNTYAPL